MCDNTTYLQNNFQPDKTALFMSKHTTYKMLFLQYTFYELSLHLLLYIFNIWKIKIKGTKICFFDHFASHYQSAYYKFLLEKTLRKHLYFTKIKDR